MTRQKAKNANRRLGDRLWSPEGQEYERRISSGYYLSEDELRAVVEHDVVRVAVQKDHSAIEWPVEAEARQLLMGVVNRRPFDLDGRRFLPTLWESGATGLVLLLEEDH